MRYDTLGDWYYEDHDDLIIDVLETEDIDHQFLIALHELVEAWLCTARGILQEQVDEFDFNFKGEDEPGDHPEAPYHKEHRFAMIIEHLMAYELGMIGHGRVE